LGEDSRQSFPGPVLILVSTTEALARSGSPVGTGIGTIIGVLGCRARGAFVAGAGFDAVTGLSDLKQVARAGSALQTGPIVVP
jgi:hypothetical protein